jgi:putative redox protein
MDLITVDRKGAAEFTIRTRNHEITTDMSAEEGGNDAGCNPVELLGAALGGCLGIMVQKYCDARGYAGDVSVSLTMQMADAPKRVAAFVADIELPDGVPEEERERLRSIVSRLPVPATLSSPPELAVEFV